MKFRKIIFLFGVLVFLYPTISDWWNSSRQSQVIKRYTEEIQLMQTEECSVLLEKAAQYNQELAENGLGKSASRRSSEEYKSILGMYADGMIGYIRIPIIDIRLPIYHGTDESVLQVGVGHMEGTSFPVESKTSHCVLSGHRGLPSAKLFTGLDRLQIGDRFKIQVLTEELWYEIEQIETVLPEDTDNIKLEEGRQLCTLVTCTPYGINTHRLLITGKRVENKTELMEEEKEKVTKGEMWMRIWNLAKWSTLCLLFVLFFLSSSKDSYAKETGQDVEIKAEIGQKESMKEASWNIIVEYGFPDVEFGLYLIETEDEFQEFLSGKGDTEKENDNRRQSLQSQTTGREGKVCFRNIERGRYVLVGKEQESERMIYRPVPVMISLPYGTDKTAQNINVKPKYETIPKEEPTEEETEEQGNESTEVPNEDSTEKTDEKPEASLPKTGQSWVIIWMFLFTGALCVITGLLKGRD